MYKACIHKIDNYKEGDGNMENRHDKEIKYLLKKIEQHEETIAQLVFMVAETNRKLTNFSPPMKDTL